MDDEGLTHLTSQRKDKNTKYFIFPGPFRNLRLKPGSHASFKRSVARGTFTFEVVTYLYIKYENI